MSPVLNMTWLEINTLVMVNFLLNKGNLDHVEECKSQMLTLGSLTFGLLQIVLELNLRTVTGLSFISQYWYQLIMVPARSSGENIKFYGMQGFFRAFLCGFC